MGMIDGAKMINKARQAKKKMEKLEVAGQGGSLAVLMNGVYEVTDTDVNLSKLQEEIGLDLSEKDLQKIANVIRKNVKDSFKDAKHQLDKQMSSQASIDDLKELFG